MHSTYCLSPVTRDKSLSGHASPGLYPSTTSQPIMLNTAFRAIRPAALCAARPANSTTLRALSTTALRRSGAPPPQLFGPGGKTGEISTDEQQATGLERFQLLGEMEGYDAFDLQALDSSRVGTLQDPIKVYSLVSSSCTNFPSCPLMSYLYRIRSVSLVALARRPTRMNFIGSAFV